MAYMPGSSTLVEHHDDLDERWVRLLDSGGVLLPAGSWEVTNDTDDAIEEFLTLQETLGETLTEAGELTSSSA